MSFRRGHTAAAKLKATDVVEVLRLWTEEGWSQARIARHLNMSETQIGRICRGTSWQHITRPLRTEEVDDSQAAMMTGANVLVDIPQELQDSLTKDLLAQKAVDAIPEFIKPSVEVAQRAAAYGVRPPDSRGAAGLQYDDDGLTASREACKLAAEELEMHKRSQNAPGGAQSTEENQGDNDN